MLGSDASLEGMGRDGQDSKVPCDAGLHVRQVTLTEHQMQARKAPAATLTAIDAHCSCEMA